MKIVEATEADGEKLKAFFSAQKVEGTFQYKVIRPGSFFDKYRLESSDFVTYYLEHQGQVEGVASLVFTNLLVDDQLQTVAYATDLRVSHNRHAIMQWAPLFFGAFEEACKKRDCDLIVSTVEHSQTEAYNALIRPQRTKRHFPRYYLFWKMYYVSLFGIWPFRRKPLKKILLQSATLGDLDELVHYWQRTLRDGVLKHPSMRDRLERQLSHWPGFKIEDLFVARDQKKNIIGTLSLWNPDNVEKIQIEAYAGGSQAVYERLLYGKAAGLTHTMPTPGETIKHRFINNIRFDNPDIFETMLFHAWDVIGKNEILNYTLFKGDYTARPPKSFISARIPYGFYTVLPPDRSLPPYLRPNPWLPPPDFESAIF